ncbi:MAG TPA: acyltransferase domain-containing protein, partial [Myxococcota bacterium]|nr:acyltransferase domain-containing protein [Myxococcota bacterium]
MAVELLDSSPAFARHMRECEAALRPFVDWSLEEVLRDEQGGWLDRLDIVQPALFATMVSLARLWEGFGVRPSVVVGHSQGEIAAAHIAGGLSLTDAARIIALRGAAMAKLAGKGGMLAVSLSPQELEPRLEPFGGRLSLAAINGPASLVVSGDPEPLGELQAACLEEGVRAQVVAVDYAAHSAQIEDLRTELLEAFAPISPRSGSIPFHSTVTGELLDTAELGAEYWYRNLRQTVRLQPVLASLLEQGQRAFIEVSPHPVLGFGLQEAIDAFPEAVDEAMVLETLRREEGDMARFSLSLAQAHVVGAELDWGAVFKGSGAKAVPLPTYPFQRKRYWLTANTDVSAGVGSAGQVAADHPLLGAVIESPEDDGLALSGRLSLQTHPWLADHAVTGTVLLPGTAFVELALRAGREVECELLEELTLREPLLLAEQGAVQLRVTIAEPDERGRREISIHSRPEREDDSALLSPGNWVRHAEGVLSPGVAGRHSEPEPLAPWPPQGASPIDLDDFYDRLAEAGFDYGPAFQGVRAAWRDGEEIYAEVALAEEQAAGAERFGIHPALLDAALHGCLLDAERTKLPFSFSAVSLHAQGPTALRVKISPAAGEEIAISLADGEGTPLGQIGSLALRAPDPAQLAGTKRQGLMELSWREVSPSAPPPSEAPELFHCRPDPELAPPEAALALSEAVLAALQESLGKEEEAPLAFLTEGAIAAAEGESADPASAAAWGLVRSAQSEHPGRFALIDTDGSEASEQALPGALALAAEEPQLALREGQALAGRVGAQGDASLALPAGPWRLESSGHGSVKNLTLVSSPDAAGPLGPSEVRVRMHAAGLNFRDVLIALGLYPGEAAIGGEGAGVVVEVGSQVEDLAPGQRVMGLIPDAFAPLARSERARLAPIPEGWSFEQAAAVPTVFLTAYHGRSKSV